MKAGDAQGHDRRPARRRGCSSSRRSSSTCASSGRPASSRTPRGCAQVRRDIARIKTIAAQKRSAGRHRRQAGAEKQQPSRSAPRARKPSRSKREMPKRTLQGVVVSDKQDKTVVVRVERRFTHPVMKKTVRRTKKYYAHDETNEYRSATSSGSRSTVRSPSSSAGQWSGARRRRSCERTVRAN